MSPRGLMLAAVAAAFAVGLAVGSATARSLDARTAPDPMPSAWPHRTHLPTEV